MEIKTTNKPSENGESLNVRGRPNDINQNGARGKSRSKSKNPWNKWWKNVKCFSCQEIGHTKRFFPKRNKKNKEHDEAKSEVVVIEDGYDSADVLIVTTSESDRKWVLEFGCSFHMSPNKTSLKPLKRLMEGR